MNKIFHSVEHEPPCPACELKDKMENRNHDDECAAVWEYDKIIRFDCTKTCQAKRPIDRRTE